MQSYKLLLEKCRSVRSKETALLLLFAFLFCTACGLVGALISSFVEYFAHSDTDGRLLLFIFSVLSFAVPFVFLVGPNTLRFLGIRGVPSINDIALRVGKYYPNIKDKVANALQIAAEHSIGSSDALIAAEVDEVCSQTKDVDFNVIIDKRKNRFVAIIFFACLFLTFLTFGIADGIRESLFRVVNFNQSFLPPCPYTLKLETTSLSLLRGEKAEIVFSATGKAPDYIFILLKENEQKNYDTFRLKRLQDSKYKYEVASANANLMFYGEGQWLTSKVLTEIGTLEVTELPFIRSIVGVLSAPYYAKGQAREITEQTADIVALRGSNASFTISANKELKNAYIVFEKSERKIDDSMQAGATDTLHYTLKCSNNKASGGFRVTQNGTYYFVIEDNDGLQNANPIKYSVVVLSDGIPTITLQSPTMDVQLTEQALLPMKAVITDDYGFSSLRLYYRLVYSKYVEPQKEFKSVALPLNTSDLVAEINYIWDLNKVNIATEDIYEFYLEVADNDAAGYKKARTQILKVRIPSMEEVMKEADVSQNQISKDLESVKKESEVLQKEMENLKQDLLKDNNKKELDWKQQQKVKEITARQERLENKIQDINKNLQQTTDKLQQNNMLSPETLQKYQELQQLLKEVRSPQELERLKQMQEEQMAKMSPDELRKMMENMKLDEEQIQKQIERTMELLKRMKAEQQADALTKRAEAIQKKQDALNKEMQNASPEKMKELSNKQEQLKDELNSLSKDTKSLQDLMKELGEDMPMQEMQEAMDALNKQQILEDMQDASQQMQSGDKSKASRAQKSASNKMQNVVQKMQKMKEQMLDMNSKANERKMQKAIEKLTEISKRQEALKNKTKNMDARSVSISDVAQYQADIFADLYNVVADLNEIGKKSFAVTPQMAADINNAVKAIRNGMDNMTERQMSAASRQQGNAMANINSALLQMKDALAQMKQSGSCPNGQNPGGGNPQSGSGSMGAGMGMMMQSMALQQQAIAQQMQQMLGQGGTNPGSMTQEQQATAQRLAEEQGKIRKSMEELAREQKALNQGDKSDNNRASQQEGNKLQNELEKMAQELKEITADIESGRINSETLKRQERIMSRMLDLQRSLNERDYEKKRESKTGLQRQLQSPSGIDLTTQEGKTRALQELLNSIKSGYTKDYEQIIRKYFEILQDK